MIVDEISVGDIKLVRMVAEVDVRLAVDAAVYIELVVMVPENDVTTTVDEIAVVDNMFVPMLLLVEVIFPVSEIDVVPFKLIESVLGLDA